ncbi:MAG TPA: hypothetical protein VHC70_08320 [Phycisphaerales bacterium]|nr:hypothetical protein [Phycisphaerales bacterium]
MAEAKSILSAEDYTNYRNIRAVAVLFVLFGLILALAGTLIAINGEPKAQYSEAEPPPTLRLRSDAPSPPLPAAFYVGMAVVGICGTIGGICTLTGVRKLAPLIYVMAVPYLLGFPIGTILSVVVLKGLRGYIKSVDQIRAVRHPSHPPLAAHIPDPNSEI